MCSNRYYLDLLQWSHGILAMESMLNAAGTSHQTYASMEPWHFSHGEEVCNNWPIRRVQWLQWSHGILAMES